MDRCFLLFTNLSLARWGLLEGIWSSTYWAFPQEERAGVDPCTEPIFFHTQTSVLLSNSCVDSWTALGAAGSIVRHQHGHNNLLARIQAVGIKTVLSDWGIKRVHDRLPHVPLDVLLWLRAWCRDALTDRLQLHRLHLLQFSCQSLSAYKRNFA